MAITYTDLAYFDDLLVDCLIDRLFYWATIRKVREYKPIRGIPENEIINIIKEEIIKPERPLLTEALNRFVNIRAIQNYLIRFQSPSVRNEFDKHAKRYLQIYLKDCGFNIEVSDRYKVRSKMLEACVIARKPLEEGEDIRYLSGFLVELTDEEEDELNKSNDKDFSIINSSRRGRNCLMLGPARFVNHDCDANARFVSSGMNMAIHAKRAISIGEEITVEYSENYFGRRNKECLCATCEKLKRNGWDTTKNWDVTSESEESDSEHDSDLDASNPSQDVSKRRLQLNIIRTSSTGARTRSAVSFTHSSKSPSILSSLSPSPLFSSRESTPSSPHTSIEPENNSSSDDGASCAESKTRRSLRPRKSILFNRATIDTISKSRKRIFEECHQHQKRFYLEPFLPENKDEILTCNNCSTPFIRPKEEKLVLRSLIRNYCPRCHRQILIYNSFWPAVKEHDVKIELYRSPFEINDDEETDSDSTDDDDTTVDPNSSAVDEFYKGGRRRKFAPAVEDAPRKASAPRRICSWLARRQKEDDKTKSLSTQSPKRSSKRRRFDKPEKNSVRHSSRLKLKKIEEEIPSPRRRRTPSRRLLESMYN